jgi:hypothetical protein
MPVQEKPFFVVGVQRSGTTVLRLMLNNHPRLAVPFESDFLKILPVAEATGPLHVKANQRIVLAALAREPFTMKGDIVKEPEAVLRHPITRFGDLICAAFYEWMKRKGKLRWGIKTPGYVTEMDVLALHFPTAQFIHIVRDGRDVALSNKGLSWGTKQLPRVARDWKFKALLGRKMGRILGERRYLEVRYEDLICDPEPQLKRICRFLGEKYHPAMLDYHKDAEAELPSSSLQWHRSSVSKPDASKAFAWRRQMSMADQILFDEYAGDVLELFGYERVRRSHTLSSRLKHAYYAL